MDLCRAKRALRSARFRWAENRRPTYGEPQVAYRQVGDRILGNRRNECFKHGMHVSDEYQQKVLVGRWKVARKPNPWTDMKMSGVDFLLIPHSFRMDPSLGGSLARDLPTSRASK